MKLSRGLAITGLVLGIAASACGAAAITFSGFALMRAGKKAKH